MVSDLGFLGCRVRCHAQGPDAICGALMALMICTIVSAGFPAETEGMPGESGRH